MSKEAMQLVETWRGLQAAETSVSRALAYRAFPLTVDRSLTELELDTALHRTSVQRALNSFEAAGFIRRHREQQPGAGHVTTRIELVKTSRFQELTDEHRPHKHPRCTEHLARRTMHLGGRTTHLPLDATDTQLNKEEDSRDSKDLSRSPSSPTPSSRSKPRQDDAPLAKKGRNHIEGQDPDCDRFIAEIQNLCRTIPGARKGFHLGDMKVAAQWWAAKISLETIEQALLLGVARRTHRKNAIGVPDAPISSLSYFLAIVDEVRAEPLPPSRVRDLRQRIELVYKKPEVLAQQAWRMVSRAVKVRLDLQLPLAFWDQAEPIKFERGVLTVSAAEEYREETHGPLDRNFIQPLREAGLPVREIVFVKRAASRSP